MTTTSTIATVTVTRGAHEQLRELIDSLAWADERHIVDTATDALGTTELGLDAQLHHLALPPGSAFDHARAVGVDQASTTWILIVDTDEMIPTDLVELLRANADTWLASGVNGVWLPRLNHVLGRPMLHSSVWPDYQLRFVRREAISFSETLHNYSEISGDSIRLPADPNHAILHYNFLSTSDFVAKLNSYSTIEADQRGPLNRPTLRPALLGFLREFLARYVKMKGYRDGLAGLHYCLLMGGYRYLIDAKRWEAGSPPAPPSESDLQRHPK